MVASGPNEAVANGRSLSTYYPTGMCQKFVRGPCWEVGSLYGSAIDAWNGAKHRHPGDRNPPKGAPTYYKGGSYGHAVISVGDGRIRSTDCTTGGQVNDAALSWPETAWGYTYLGWTEDINGVMCPNLGSGGGNGDEDDMEQSDKIGKWSPDDGDTGDTTIGKTLNQARGYAEDGYQRVKALEKKVDGLDKKLDKILGKL